MKTTTQVTVTVTRKYEAGDDRPQIPNNFRRSHVWVAPTEVSVRFDRDTGRVVDAVVTGQQFHMYASGEVKRTGPGRSHPDWEPTIWRWPTEESMPRELAQLTRELRREI